MIKQCIAYNEKNESCDHEALSGLYNILGMLHRECGQYDEAEVLYKKAIAIKPEKPDPHHNYGHLLLLKGNYIHAWEELEWRKQTSQFIEQKIETSIPEWQGEDLTDKILFIQAEQGVGDEVFFGSVIQLLPHHTMRKIIFGCDRRLKDSFELSYPSIECFNRNNKNMIANVHADYYVMLASLPYRVHLFQHHQALQPYLCSDSQKKHHFQTILSARARHKMVIGFAWRTMGHFTQRRNLQLQELHHLLTYEDFFIVPVQYQQQDKDKQWA